MIMKAIAIDHVQLTVPPELEVVCRDFYANVLGLREIPKPAALMDRGGYWFEIGEVQLHIAIEAGATGAGSKRHLCLRVADLAAARAALSGVKMTITEEPITANGLERFFIRDPAGNRLEIGWCAAK